MQPQTQRALLLYEQGRYDLAVQELRSALVDGPSDGFNHSLLALCLLRQNALREAEEQARLGVGASPEDHFSHYALAAVLHGADREKEALAVIEEALRLDPGDATTLSLAASIHLARRNWQVALDHAERGLQSDPEHVGCTNVRAIALVKLGRREEAGATIDAALRRNPEDATSHANQGWTLLEKGDPKKALEHFREALRLEPDNEWARQGIVEALKARNFVYALMLRYFLFMSRLSFSAQWAIIIGGMLGARFLNGLSEKDPSLAPWLLPVQATYIIFVILTWIAQPLFNLLLRMNKFGRMVLSREETIVSTLIGAMLAGAMVAGGLYFFTKDSVWVVVALLLALQVLPTAAAASAPPGNHRKFLIAFASFLALCALLTDLVPGAVVIFFLGILATPWISNALSMSRARR